MDSGYLLIYNTFNLQKSGCKGTNKLRIEKGKLKIVNSSAKWHTAERWSHGGRRLLLWGQRSRTGRSFLMSNARLAKVSCHKNTKKKFSKEIILQKSKKSKEIIHPIFEKIQGNIFFHKMMQRSIPA